MGNGGKTWETICAQEAAIVPCERALKCPQGAMKICVIILSNLIKKA